MALNRFLSTETGSVKVDVTNPVLKTSNETAELTLNDILIDTGQIVTATETAADVLDVPGFLDPANSSQTPLAGAATFMGTWLSVIGYSEVTVVYNTDVLGSLFMDVSTNGVDQDLSKPVTNVAVGVHTLVITGPYFRIRWINGAAAQGHFRLSTLFHRFKSKDLTSTASQILSDKNDVATVRVINGPLLDVSRDLISDKYTIHFFGTNPASSTSWEDVWVNGGDYPFLDVAQTIQIQSVGSAYDVVGPGARVVTVQGLDAAANPIIEDIETNGGGLSAESTQLFFRVTFARVKEVGTKMASNYNDLNIQTSGVGPITLATIIGEETVGTLGYGVGITQLGVSTVPDQHTAFLQRIEVDSDSTKTADVHLYKRSQILDTVAPFRPRELLWANANVRGPVVQEFDSFISIDGPADVWFRAKLDNGTDTRIDVNVDVIVVRNNLN